MIMRLLIQVWSIVLVINACGQEKKYMPAIRFIKDAADCNDFWVKVHGIEYLIALDLKQEAGVFVDSAFKRYVDSSQKRIGVWRVLWQLQEDRKQRWPILDRIAGAYLDQHGSDRVHAAETLAKLGYSLKQLDSAIVRADMRSGGALAAFVHWGHALPMHESGKADVQDLMDLIEKPDDETQRKIAAYALGFTGGLSDAQWERLSEIALDNDSNTPSYPYLLGAAYSLYNGVGQMEAYRYKQIALKLLRLKEESGEAKVVLCRALAVHCGHRGKMILKKMMRSGSGEPADLDIKAAAAFALLRTQRL